MTSRKMKGTTGNDLIKLGKAAFSLKKQGKFREAEEKYLDLLKKDPDNTYALVGIGDIKRVKKDFQEAVRYYRQMY